MTRPTRPGRASSHHRALRFEPLEDRRLLAALLVNSPLDIVAADGVVTLREAISAANSNTATELGHVGNGPDTITFAPALSGQTIALSGSELTITESLAIDASALAAHVTINAPSNSEVFNITASSGDYNLAGLTLHGSVIASGNVALVDCVVSGSQSNPGGFFGYGGILAIGNVTVTRCTIVGNNNGGIRGNDVTVIGSTISDNSVAVQVAIPPSPPRAGGSGGGIYALGDVTVVESTISGNFAGTSGGGIFSNGNVTVTGSTIDGNSVSSYSSNYSNYDPGYGGGIYANGNVTITSSTISGNNAFGGSLVFYNPPYGHETFPGAGQGGGIWNGNGEITIIGSVIAQNVAEFGGSYDINAGVGPISVHYSLIGYNNGTGLAGAPIGSPDANGNLIGTAGTPINPKLDTVLRDNGGRTLTRALLPGSPAINAGDAAAAAGIGGIPDFDQRGTPFSRVSGGRIDMGAFEVQVPVLTADYNRNGTVDAADFVLWRKTLNQSVTPNTGADGSGNGTIDQADYDLWRTHFGEFVDDHGQGSIYATTVGVPSTTSGIIDFGSDVDWFRFTAATEFSHRFQVTLQGLGNATLRVIAGDGTTQLAIDNDGGAALIDWTPSVAGTYFLEVSGVGGSTGTYQLLVSGDDHGDSAALATSITVTSPYNNLAFGVIGTENDVDWFRFAAAAGVVHRFQTTLQTLASSALRLIDSDGTTQLIIDNDGGLALIEWTPATGGTYYLEVSGLGGSTGTYQLLVSRDDHADSAAFATMVAVPGSSSGVIGVDDVDWFKFTATTGVSHRFYTAFHTPGNSALRLIASDGTTLLAIDNDGGTAQIDWTPSTGGTYFLEVGGVGGSVGSYYVNISRDDHGDNATFSTSVNLSSTTNGEISTPSDVDWFRFTAAAGQNYWILAIATSGPVYNDDIVVRLVGTDGVTELAIDGDGRLVSILWNAPTAGTYYVEVSGQNGAIGYYNMSVTLGDDYGNSAAFATPVTLPTTRSGVISSLNDSDWFSFSAVGGVQYRFETFAGTLTDTELTLRGTNGVDLIEYDNDDGPGFLSLINWTAPASGTYYIEVEGWNTLTGSYQLKLSFPTTAFDSEATSNATVQPAGPRTGTSGQNFFNVEGSNNGANASYGVARFNSTAIKALLDASFGAGNWTISTIDLVLTQSNTAFSTTGLVSVLFTNDDAVSIVPGSSPLAFPHNNGEFPDAVQVVNYTYTLNFTGTVDTYRIFDEVGSNSAGSLALKNDLIDDSTKTVLFAPGAVTTAATYAGIGNATFAGPTLVVTAWRTVPGAASAASIPSTPSVALPADLAFERFSTSSVRANHRTSRLFNNPSASFSGNRAAMLSMLADAAFAAAPTPYDVESPALTASGEYGDSIAIDDSFAESIDAALAVDVR